VMVLPRVRAVPRRGRNGKGHLGLEVGGKWLLCVHAHPVVRMGLWRVKGRGRGSPGRRTVRSRAVGRGAVRRHGGRGERIPLRSRDGRNTLALMVGLHVVERLA